MIALSYALSLRLRIHYPVIGVEKTFKQYQFPFMPPTPKYSLDLIYCHYNKKMVSQRLHPNTFYVVATRTLLIDPLITRSEPPIEKRYHSNVETHVEIDLTKTTTSDEDHIIPTTSKAGNKNVDSSAGIDDSSKQADDMCSAREEPEIAGSSFGPGPGPGPSAAFFASSFDSTLAPPPRFQRKSLILDYSKELHELRNVYEDCHLQMQQDKLKEGKQLRCAFKYTFLSSLSFTSRHRVYINIVPH